MTATEEDSQAGELENKNFSQFHDLNNLTIIFTQSILHVWKVASFFNTPSLTFKLLYTLLENVAASVLLHFNPYTCINIQNGNFSWPVAWTCPHHKVGPQVVDPVHTACMLWPWKIWYGIVKYEVIFIRKYFFTSWT